MSAKVKAILVRGTLGVGGAGLPKFSVRDR